MTRPTAIRRAAFLTVIVLLAAAYLIWRSVAISQAADQLQNQMKVGAINLIEDRFKGPEAQRKSIREVVERVHAQAFERCDMESSFWPIGTRRRKGGAEVSVNVQQYLKGLHSAILSEAGQKGIEIDGAELERAILVTP